MAANSLTEQEATRQLFLAVGALVLLGVLLLVGTVVWWRSTRPEPPALAPLEVMGSRRWEKASEAERRRLADEVRPHGPRPASERSDPVPLELVRTDDEEAEADRFDDLRELDELLGALTGAGNGAVAEADAEVDAASVAGAAAPVDDEQASVDDDVPAAADEAPAVVAVDRSDHADAEREADDRPGSDEDSGDGTADGTTTIAIDPLLRLSQTD